MKLLATIVILAFCLGAFAQLDPHVTNTNPVQLGNAGVELLRLSALTTNRYTNFLATLRVEPILTPCPECGQANHHERRIEHVEVYDLVTATLVSGGQTNVARVYQSPRTAAVVTNVVLRLQARRQPGWTNAPVPMP